MPLQQAAPLFRSSSGASSPSSLLRRVSPPSCFAIAQLCNGIMKGFEAMIQPAGGSGEWPGTELATVARTGHMTGTRSYMAFSFLAREAGRVQICGHRGYSLHYPENTLQAFQAAKSWGATMVEIDVVLTADDEPIVLHDLTISRSTGRPTATALQPISLSIGSAGSMP